MSTPPSLVKEVVEEVIEDIAFNHPSEFVPSTWNIQPHDDGIHATNNITGRIFLGAISVFNKRLRGL